ncbi:uncharacterized protein LOC143532774 [Bidens hawaiensis]|uniref:uncharacterized protein LOC143532774 n=1 Tax=Bidens hawaiensis TaxID=980011 RepID=UPI00404A9D4E
MSSTRRSLKRPRDDLPATQSFASYTNTEIVTTTSPTDLCSVLRGLTADQKSDIKDMGFESITSFSIDKIPTGLGHWLLVNYDHNTSVLNVGSTIIEVTRSKAHDVLGVPMGNIPVSENKAARKGDIIRKEWKDQFLSSKITVKNVTDKLKLHRKGGRLFKANFLVVFNSILGETTKVAMVNQKFLASINNEDDIPNMDWCGYIITCLKRTKDEWDGGRFNGPLTFLAALYAYELQLKCSPEKAITPAIKYVTTLYLVEAEALLQGQGQGQGQTDEGQTVIDQNVTACQENEEDEDAIQSTNPAGNDDTRIIMHGDESILHDDDIQLVEPKQEECELDESAVDFVYVKGYRVDRSIAPTLVEILKKHGDFARASKVNSVIIFVVESVCKVYERIQTNDVMNMSEEEGVVSAAKALKMDVSWLEGLLDGSRKRRDANKEYGLWLETKACIDLAERGFEKDMIRGRAKLLEAHRQLKETLKFKEAMHIVGKHLNDTRLMNGLRV